MRYHGAVFEDLMAIEIHRWEFGEPDRMATFTLLVDPRVLGHAERDDQLNGSRNKHKHTLALPCRFKA